MFFTFRKRILFWFFVFISSSLLVIALSILYLQQRERIARTTSLIEDTFQTLLKKVVAQQAFLSLDTKNGQFFQNGESAFLEESAMLSDSSLDLINQAEANANRRAQTIQQELARFEYELLGIDSIFNEMVEKLRKRGFKDFSLEGQMREDAHWLEDINEIPKENILSLRRHEKDYIIRNDQKYVDQLNMLVSNIQNRIYQNPSIRTERKDLIISRLNGYQEKFNRLVDLDSEIGIKDNTGLKKQLDDRILNLENGFEALVNKAKDRREQMFRILNWIFATLIIILFIISIIGSYLISRRITQPLTDLTVYITRFVDSNFTLEDENPQVRTKDEIGKLTENFSILKEEIISQLKFFKEKVEERTLELAEANEKLRKVNKANSRFVPDEFLHFLGKDNIVQVQLGDQIQQEMTILFTDIRSFTKISETLSPQENFDFINMYLDKIVPIIRRNNGIIDKFIGDNVMALFPHSPEDALQAAIEFDHALQEFNAEQEKLGHQAIEIGTGIHTGQLILGTIGNEERLETTVISDAVNIASRLEGLTKHYHAKVITTEESLQRLAPNHTFHYRFLDKVKVKGKTTTLSVFELITESDELKLSYQKEYHSAVELLRKKQLKEAIAIFSYLSQLNPADEALKAILKKSKTYLQKGLPENWDGVVHMKEK